MAEAKLAVYRHARVARARGAWRLYNAVLVLRPPPVFKSPICLLRCQHSRSLDRRPLTSCTTQPAGAEDDLPEALLRVDVPNCFQGLEFVLRAPTRLLRSQRGVMGDTVGQSLVTEGVRPTAPPDPTDVGPRGEVTNEWGNPLVTPRVACQHGSPGTTLARRRPASVEASGSHPVVTPSAGPGVILW